MGRSVHCPTCGIHLTARPLGIEARLAAQQERILGQPGLGAAAAILLLLVLAIPLLGQVRQLVPRHRDYGR